MERDIRVLYVTDDPDAADLVAEYLEGADQQLAIVSESDARAGFDRLVAGEIDCICSDYDVPGMDGLTFLETVREDYPGMPFILLAADGSEAVASEAISAGVTDYVGADAGADRYERVANRIASAVERYRAERERREKSHLLDSIFKHIPTHLFVKDADGRHLHVSEYIVDQTVGPGGRTAPGDRKFRRTRCSSGSSSTPTTRKVRSSTSDRD